MQSALAVRRASKIQVRRPSRGHWTLGSMRMVEEPYARTPKRSNAGRASSRHRPVGQTPHDRAEESGQRAAAATSMFTE